MVSIYKSLRANTMAQLTCQYQRLDKAGGNFVENNFGMFGALNYLLQVEPNPRTIEFRAQAIINE